MSRRSLLFVALPALAASALLLAGCGGGSASTASPTTSSSSTSPSSPSSPTAGAGAAATGPASQAAGALTAEAQQTASGDIPDNQVFLTFSDTAVGYSLEYPEGWAQQGAGKRVTFRDKNNLVRVSVTGGGSVTVAEATAEMGRLRQQTPSLRFDPPSATTVAGKPAVKVVYSTRSAPNPVTGKRVTLVVDRYYVPGVGRHAVVDLGTPQGVDNVDAYRLMIQSFRWR